MRGRLLVFILLGVAAVFSLIFARTRYMSRNLPHEQEKRLRILTYSSFFGGGGPGPRLLGEFKRICNCEMDTISAGDAGLILERLKLTQESSPVDVVVGIDQMAVHEALSLKWQRVNVDTKFAHGVHSEFFVPIDWSPLSFIYRGDTKNPPAKFSDLLKPEYKNQIALQDPRSSSPGLQFLQWVRGVKQEDTKSFLKTFQPNIASVSPSWSFSYGLFQKKQAKYVFSYVTSLAYHWGIEKDRSFKIASFPEGHPVQVEYAAVPEGCKQCELAHKFVQFLTEPVAQKILMEMNFMFPVNSSVIGNSVFAELPQLKVRVVPVEKDMSDWNEVFK